MLNRSIVALSLGVALSGLAGCSSTSRVSGLAPASVHLGTHTTDEHTIAASVFQPPVPGGPITVQGVISDPNTGQPIPGPTNVRVEISTDPNGGPSGILILTDFLGVTYDQGRFTFTVNQPDADDLLLAAQGSTVYTVIKDLDTNSIVGAALPIRHTPLALAAEVAGRAHTATSAGYADVADHATSATSAENALNASFAANADHANTAEALTGTDTVLLTPSTGYSNYGSGYAPIQATRVGNMVILNGLVSATTTGTITILPEGYRPAARHIFSANAHNAMSRVDVSANGSVFLSVLNGVTWVPLDGISFPVAP